MNKPNRYTLLKSAVLAVAFFLVGSFAYAQSIVITTAAGDGILGYFGDGGPATAAGLNGPTSVAVDAGGNMYIADPYNNRVRIVNGFGTISTFAGNGNSGYSGDAGFAASAQLSKPFGVAADTHGNIYIADADNNVIRKVNNVGIISTFAGTGTLGYSGDGGQALSATFSFPCAVATDAAGNVYIADYGNNCIRKVSPNGVVITIAGNGFYGYYGDGDVASVSELASPTAVALDAAGNIYIADYMNYRIRKINTAGTISTIAGNGISGYVGDGGLADTTELQGPIGVAVDASGNVYISDKDANRVRMINNAGIISTYAGSGYQGYIGDGGAPTAADLYNPWGLAFDGSGNLLIADCANRVVRMVGLFTGIKEHDNTQAPLVYPVPARDMITAQLSGKDFTGIDIVDLTGRIIYSHVLEANEPDQTLSIDLSATANGIYLMQFHKTTGAVSRRIDIQH
jgi:hypothetical protein